MIRFLKINRKKNLRFAKGQGLVEFALAIPILLMVVIGIYESGRLLFIYTTTVSASRSAARLGTATGYGGSGVPHYLDCSGITQKAMDFGVLSGMEPSDISITYLLPGEVTPRACGSVSSDALEFGSRIQVVVVGHFQPIPYFTNFFPEFNIVSESRRTIIKGVQIGN